jgi:hypothetical protein
VLDAVPSYVHTQQHATPPKSLWYVLVLLALYFQTLSTHNNPTNAAAQPAAPQSSSGGPAQPRASTESTITSQHFLKERCKPPGHQESIQRCCALKRCCPRRCSTNQQHGALQFKLNRLNSAFLCSIPYVVNNQHTNAANHTAFHAQAHCCTLWQPTVAPVAVHVVKTRGMQQQRSTPDGAYALPQPQAHNTQPMQLLCIENSKQPHFELPSLCKQADIHSQTMRLCLLPTLLNPCSHTAIYTRHAWHAYAACLF